MLSGYSVHQWQEQYQVGAFDSKDAAVQREAGWWRWHCRDDVVANRLKRIAPVVMGIKSPLIWTNVLSGLPMNTQKTNCYMTVRALSG